MDDKNRYNLTHIHNTRNQAEMLRDQLQAEYNRLLDEKTKLPPNTPPDPRREQGLEAMRKAIAANNCAIESIDQALRELGQVGND